MHSFSSRNLGACWAPGRRIGARGTPRAMPSSDDLRARLRSIDGRGYGAYKDLKGRWDGRRVSLCLDRIQGDPFAAPSKARLLVQGHGLPRPRRISGPTRLLPQPNTATLRLR